MSEHQKAIADFSAVYRRQEKQFLAWMCSYYEAAFWLEHISKQVGKRNLADWLKLNCPGVDVDICKLMLDKLHNTPTGRRILDSVQHPDQFSFPA